MARNEEAFETYPLEDVVSTVARAGLDLMVIVRAKARVSRSNDIGVFKFTTNFVIDKMAIQGTVPKSRPEEAESGLNFTPGALDAVIDISEVTTKTDLHAGAPTGAGDEAFASMFADSAATAQQPLPVRRK